MRRLRDNGGFTLSETLMAVLLLLLVSLVVVGGIPSARTAYVQIADSANAQVLLSTAASKLRDELSCASGVQIEGSRVSYTSGNTKRPVELFLYTDENNVEKGLALRETDGPPRLLAEDIAGGGTLAVTWERIEYSAKVFTVTNLQVKRIGEDTVLAEFPLYQVRTVMK